MKGEASDARAVDVRRDGGNRGPRVDSRAPSGTDPRPSAGSMWSTDGRDLLPSAPANDIRDAYRGYYAYFGTWEVDERAHRVTHHIRGSLRSVEVGANYVRPYEFSGEQLLFRSPVSGADGETRVITWRRAGRFQPASVAQP